MQQERLSKRTKREMDRKTSLKEAKKKRAMMRVMSKTNHMKVCNTVPREKIYKNHFTKLGKILMTWRNGRSSC